MSTGLACDFARDYEIGQSPLMLAIERCVRGSDYGATSWTTHAQAEAAASRLRLATGRCLLELGAGSGWPALLLASLSGCEVVITDLPLSGLRIARARALRDGLENRCSVLAADGTALPFADHVFDSIHHADVLCCMERKLEMLQECRRVGREGARMEFSVIVLAREPSDTGELGLLKRSGPPYPDAGADYAVLLRESGWNVLERFNVTAEFAHSMELLVQEYQSRHEALLDLLGEQDYTERLERRCNTRAAVLCGLLRREIFLTERS